MASLGVRTIDELIGRTDLLEPDKEIFPLKAGDIDYSNILYRPEVSERIFTSCTVKQDHQIGKVLDKKLIKLCESTLEKAEPVKFKMDINNGNRTTGAMLSGEVCRQFGEGALADDTIHVKFKGTAGQSFGAWLVKGITFELEGMANDYLGKGISGGRIIVYPDIKAAYKAEENIIIGNTTFYGAIKGEAYIRGVAGERFCIRNSGLYAVCEGVGDHGCEYMTGGRVIVIGKTGGNFAAGMSGGIAYVYDKEKDFDKKCNKGMVELLKLSKEDKKAVRLLLGNHYKYTKSRTAKRLLDNFTKEIKKFIKVMPIEYKRILEGAQTGEELLDLTEYSDG
jgi:glutamate synthase (ferredoxin)